MGIVGVFTRTVISSVGVGVSRHLRAASLRLRDAPARADVTRVTSRG